MKHRNDRTSVIALTCPTCGNPSGRYAKSGQARFKHNIAYIDDLPCDGCSDRIKKMAEQLVAGGTMCFCNGCKAVTVVMEVDPQFLSLVDQLPDGTKCLEVPTCSLCNQK